MTEDRAERLQQIEENILQLAGGDGNALEPLYELTHTGVYAFALSITRNIHDAEDVVQETFLRICDAAPRYRANGNPLPWIMTIAKNLSLMKLREYGRQDMLPYEDWEKLTAALPRVTSEDQLVLYAALYRLSAAERQLIALHVVGGFLHRECAEMLHLPLSTVLSRYNRAMRKLQHALEESQYEEN